MRRSYLLLVLSFALFSPFRSQAQEVSLTKEKPNIIFILVDDMGFGDMGVFFQNKRKENEDLSEPWLSTPNLDKMASEGAMLTQHYTPAPVCAPSRASLLSGLSQGHTQVRNNQFDKALGDNHTLGNVLQKAGYKTAAIGKWGLQGLVEKENENPENWPAYPTKRGFDYFYGYVRHIDGHEHYPKEGVYRGKKEVWHNNKEVSDGLDKSYTTDLWTANAKKWIVEETKKDDKPFFMYLAYDTPHAVLELPTQAYPEGGGLKGGLQFTGTPGKMINTASGEPDSWTHPDYANAVYDHDNNPETDLKPWPETYKRYATSIRRIDNGVGDILQLLKDLDIDSNTMVVFASDNGPSIESYLPGNYAPNQANFFDSFGPYDGIKRDVLEGGLRTPLIAWWPERIPKNKVVETPSIFYDWLPTFANAAGLPAPVNTNGVSLLPALTGEGEQEESTVYVEYFQNGKSPNYEEFSPQNRLKIRKQMQMLRIGDFVGLRYDIKSADDDFAIFNVLEDTHQGENLATNDSMAALQQKMKNKVLQIRSFNSTAVRPYDSVAVPAVTTSKLSRGINWEGYDGDSPWLPQVNSLPVAANGKIKKPKFKKTLRKEHDVFVFNAFIKVPETGEYTFYLNANNRSFLKIHQINVLDGDYNFKKGEELQATIQLEKGFHPLQLYYKKRKGIDPELELQWDGPGFNRKQVSSEKLFRNK